MKKRLGGILLTLAMVLALVPAGVVPVRAENNTWDGTTIADEYAGGSGTEADPYQIATGAQLAYFAQQVNGGTTYSGVYFLLTSEINLNNQAWIPIGNYSSSYRRFSGSFDGDGHTISNLNVNSATLDYQGLFGYCDGSTLKNLSVGGSVTGKQFTGGIVGHLQGGTIKFCSSSVTVSGSSYVGGIAGKQSQGPIEYCSNTGAISGTFCVGGIAGQQYGASIKRCYNTGSISGTTGDAGGISGSNYANSVENCYNTGDITGENYDAGGIAGKLTHSASSVKNCYNVGTVTLTDANTGENPGGIVGDGSKAADNNVTACFFLDTATTYGIGSNPSNANAASKSGTELKAQSTFTGWDFTGIWEIVEGSSYPTLRPIYTVTFDSDGGSAVASVAVAGGNAVTQPTAPTKDGYIFVKWQKGSTDYDFSTPVTANIILTAQWSVINYNIWIGGTRVTSVNTSDVLGDGKVSYDAESSTLMLNGATIEAGYAFATGKYALIGAKDMNLTIHVTGSSSLQSRSISDTTNGGISLVGSSDNTLTITVDEGKTLTTFGNPALSSAASESSGIYTDGALVINGAGTINATGDNSGQSSYGIHAKNGITISNGIITATADTLPTSGSYGISAGGNGLKIIGGDITASGKNKAILHTTTVNSTLRGVGYTALDAAEGTSFEAGNGLDLHDYKKVRFFPAVPVTGVTLNKTSAALTVGGTETLTATVAPANATNKAVAWSSSNEGVATVDANGVVTAVAPGTATVTVTTEDGNHTATCTVTVGKAMPSLTAPTAKTGLTYTGEAQELVTAGSTTGGTLQYKLGGSGSYGTSVPTAKDAGSYTVFYRVVGDADHSDIAEQSVPVTISQAALTVRAYALKKAYGAAVPTLTYAVEGLKGSDKASAVLTGAPATTANSTSNAGDYSITQGTLAANANYALSFAGATLTVLKAAQAAPAKGAGYTITGAALSVDTASTNPSAGNTTHYEIFDGATIHTSGSVTMAANKTYYVRWGSGTNYNPSPYTEIPAEVGVTVMAAPASMGSVTTAGLTDGKCKIGSTVTVTAIPSSGCEFINWLRPDGSSAGTNAAYSFTATESVILVAAFKEKDKVVATLPTVENKTYTGSAQNGVKAAGTGCTITGTQSATDAGTYTITASLASGYDVWPDGTTAPKALTWRVDKAAQAAPAVEVTDTTISVTISSSQTVNYSTDRETWSNASASMTGMAAGSYYFYTVGDDNHYDSPITVAYVSAPTITATTIQPSALTATGVTLNGTVEPKAYANGTYLSAVGFEYKAVGGSWIAVDGTIGGAFNASLSGLAEDTDYVCRAVVTLKDGSTKTYGAEITFHTPKAAPPDDGKIKAVIQSESEADTRKVFVSVERGNDVIATSDTVALNGNSGAEVSFDKLPYGHYNVVVHTVDGDYTATNMLSVEGGSEVATRFTIPIGKLATIVEVKTEETPKTAVEGLNEILTPEDKNNAAAGSQDVEIRLEVEKKPEDAADGASEIKGLDDNKIDTYLDMSLFKTTTDLDAQGNATSIETMDIGSTNTEVVEIAIPYANTSRSGLTMYRYHNALAEILTMLTAKPVGAFLDGTYYVDRTGGYIFLYASGFSTYAIGFAESAVYTVTFDANGGTGTMASQSIHGTAALNANAFTRSGYTFNGWNTAADGSGTSYANAANITPTADLTLYAQWKSNSPGSDTPSGGNDGYFPSTPTTGASDTVPVSGESGSVSVSVTVSGVTATIKAPTTAELNKVIGESVKTGDIVMDLRELNRDIATASIPAETIRAIEKAVSDPGNDASSLTIKLTDGSVTFDAKALAAVAEQMKGSNLQLHLDGVGTSGLNAAQQAAIKAMDVQAVYDIYLTSNGVRITDFKDGSATVTVAYTLKSGQMGSGVDVWYVADGGKMEEIPTRYDSKEATFTVEHFSNYVVVYDEERTASGALNGYADCPRGAACPISTFKDTNPTEWYHDGVHWALENGVMNGVGDGLFLPNGTTSRAQVATILWRLAGRAQVSGESTFTDVAEGMWYTDAICWAAAQGVVTGFEHDGMNVFDPDAAITREQLAVMLYRYAKLDGRGFTGAWMFMLDYPDAADVSEWADEAMHWVIMKGIINGMDGRLNPQSSATRAQTATMFMRYYAESVK